MAQGYKAMAYGKIVLVEKLDKMRWLISDYLEYVGVEVLAFSQADSPAQEAACIADVIVISCEQFDNGIDAPVAMLRGEKNTPVIAIRSRVSRYSEQVLIQQGANEVVTRPMSIETLFEAICRQLKIPRPLQFLPPQPVCRCRGLYVDIDRGIAALNGKKLALTHKEMKLLYLLMSHKNHILEHEVLTLRVWGNTKISRRTLAVYICNIRKKLGSYGALIHTAKPSGYFFSEKDFNFENQM